MPTGTGSDGDVISPDVARDIAGAAAFASLSAPAAGRILIGNAGSLEERETAIFPVRAGILPQAHGGE